MKNLYLILIASISTATMMACDEAESRCGPGEASDQGLTLSIESASLTFGNATTSPNNDCSVSGAPTSLTLDIIQLNPAPAMRRALTLCVPRPDQLDEPRDLTTDAVTTGVQVIDLFADSDDCLISLDRSRPPMGTATFIGACDDGTHSAGYALELSGQLPATRTCQGQADQSINVQLSGTFSVSAL